MNKKLIFQDITKLENEYETLYQEALILKNNPESAEFKRNETLRHDNLKKRRELILRR